MSHERFVLVKTEACLDYHVNNNNNFISEGDIQLVTCDQFHPKRSGL